MPRNSTRLFIQRGALVLLGLLLAELWTTQEMSCERDAPIQINEQHSFPVSSCDCYSESYTEARNKFRNAVSNHKNATLYTFQVVNDYTMDIAVVSGTLPGTVIHTSGYHGVEGFAGSAIQIAWLLRQRQQDIPTVVLVHAVNPFGFATWRRTNENNVDLNRNGLHPNEWPKAHARDFNTGNYKDFDEILLNPRRAPTLWDLYFNIYLVAAVSIFKHGLVTLKRAMVTGQYHYDKGIFYGGRELQPSLQILDNFFKEHVPQNETATMINVHTGLGPSGQDTILTTGNSAISPQELSTVFRGSNIPSLTQSASQVSEGYDLVMGTAEDFFSRRFYKQQDWIITQEFGTVSSVSVGISLVLENMARQFLPEEEAIKWTYLLKRAFYKQTSKWRQSILVRGLRVMQQALDRTASV
jgi:hypothetical protein